MNALDAFLGPGADMIATLQSFRPGWFVAAMKVITLAGDPGFYLVLLPFLFWCVDEHRGARATLLLFVSMFANTWIKDAVNLPRPYQVRPELGLSSSTGASFPSGHAQASATFWGFMRRWIGGAAGWIAAFAVPALIGFSRIYLGVHYPTDVLAGWLLGAAFVVAYRFGFSRLESRVGLLNPRMQTGLVAGVALLFCVLRRDDVSVAALFFGSGLGYITLRSRVGFTAAGSAWKKLLRFAIGIAGLVGLYFGLSRVVPGSENPNYRLFVFAQYGSMGAWVTLFAPWIFVKLNLAGTRAIPDAGKDESNGDEDGSDGDSVKN